MKAKKDMKGVLDTNRIYLPLLFILFSIIFEIANFLYLGFKSGDSAMIFPSYFLYDLAIICMLATVIFAMPGKKTMNIFFVVFLFLQFLLNLVNTTMYSIFGDILSWDLLKLGAEATTAITMDFIDWGGAFLNLALFAVMITSIILLQKYNRKTIEIKKHLSMPIIAVAVLILSMSINVCLFNVQTSYLKAAATGESEIETSDQYLWDNFQFKIEAYKKFGHFGFYTKSILNFIFPDTPTESERQTYIEYIDEGHVDGDETAPLYNDNLIVILCESVDSFAIDPINTPTVWSLLQGQDTISFTNFRARNRTNISEGITLLGSMPKNYFLYNVYNAGYEFDYSLPNVFKRAGDENVVTTYIHPNTFGFYQRNVTHTPSGLGFDQKFSIEDYTGEQVFERFGDWVTDLSFTQCIMDEILPTDTRFLTYFSTLSTHGPYTSENPDFQEYYDLYDANYEEFAAWQEENTDFIMPTNQSDWNKYRLFKAQMIDFDRTIENLLNEIEIRGLKDNTSIMFFADHNTYYHDLTYKIKGIEKSDFSSTEINHIPMFLYSPKLTQGQGYNIDTFCNTYDILPTLCDLYGMESNTNLYHGYSIFSSEIGNSIFASHLGGIFTDDIYSNNIADVYILGDDVTEDEITKFKENASNFYRKERMLETIYSNGINGTIR